MSAPLPVSSSIQAESTSDKSITLSKPSSVATGDFLLAVLSIHRANGTWTIPAGWTYLATPSLMFVGTMTNVVMWKFATSSEPSSYTFSWAEYTAPASGVILCLSGVRPTTPISVNSISRFLTAYTGTTVKWPTFTGITVGAASNGVNVNTFTGSGVLHISSGSGLSVIPGVVQSVTVTITGTAVPISYTAILTKTSTPALVGCTASGSHVLQTGQAISQRLNTAQKNNLVILVASAANGGTFSTPSGATAITSAHNGTQSLAVFSATQATPGSIPNFTSTATESGGCAFALAVQPTTLTTHTVAWASGSYTAAPISEPIYQTTTTEGGFQLGTNKYINNLWGRAYTETTNKRPVQRLQVAATGKMAVQSVSPSTRTGQTQKAVYGFPGIQRTFGQTLESFPALTASWEHQMPASDLDYNTEAAFTMTFHREGYSYGGGGTRLRYVMIWTQQHAGTYTLGPVRFEITVTGVTFKVHQTGTTPHTTNVILVPVNGPGETTYTPPTGTGTGSQYIKYKWPSGTVNLKGIFEALYTKTDRAGNPILQPTDTLTYIQYAFETRNTFTELRNYTITELVYSTEVNIGGLSLGIGPLGTTPIGTAPVDTRRTSMLGLLRG